MIQWYRNDTFESVSYSERNIRQNGFPKLVFSFSLSSPASGSSPPCWRRRGGRGAQTSSASPTGFCLLLLFSSASALFQGPHHGATAAPLHGPLGPVALVAPGSSPPPTPLTPAACHFTSALGSHHTHTHTHAHTHTHTHTHTHGHIHTPPSPT